jgi:hypothetical protein
MWIYLQDQRKRFLGKYRSEKATVAEVTQELAEQGLFGILSRQGETYAEFTVWSARK